MDWTDTAIVLSARRHGETSAVVHLFTAEHGRHAGLVRGGAGRRARSVLQPGNEVQATWRARLSEQLGWFTLEMTNARAATVLDEPARLAAFAAAAEILDAALPEREPHAAAYAAFRDLLVVVAAQPDWPADYARWELALLRELGFAPDLSGAGGGDWSVSTRTGQAEVGNAFGLHSLAVPQFLVTGGPASDDDVAAALKVTGAFLLRAVHDQRGALPGRTRLVERLARGATKSGINLRP